MTRQVFQISIARISMFPFQVAEIITADNLATDIRLAVQYRNHHRVGRRGFINNPYNPITIHHSHFGANTGRGTFIERDIIINQIQTVLYHMRFKQLIIRLRHLPDAVDCHRIELLPSQCFFQISDLLFEHHVAIQQIFIDRFQMKIRGNPSRNFINRPHNRIGRSEECTLLITVEPK